MLETLIERVGAGAQLTLEVRRSNAGAIDALRALRLPCRGRPAALLPGQRRGRARHVAHAGDAARHPRRRARAHDPRHLETSCDDTCAAVVTPPARCARTSSPPRACTGASAASCRSGRRAITSSWSTWWSTTRWLAHGATLDDIDAVAVTQGPGLVARCSSAWPAAKGLAAARRLPLAPVDHLQGHVAANFLAPDRSSRRSCAWWPPAGTRAGARHRLDGYERLGADAGRRGRRGVRQGGADAGPRLPGRAGAVAAGRGGRPGRLRVPDGSPGRGPRLLLRGPEARCSRTGERWAEWRRTGAADLAASYEHAIVEAWCCGVERRLVAEPSRGSRSAGAWPRTACCARVAGAPWASRVPRATARALHRQRGDDRERGPLRRTAALPASTWRSTRSRRTAPGDRRSAGHRPAAASLLAARPDRRRRCRRRRGRARGHPSVRRGGADPRECSRRRRRSPTRCPTTGRRRCRCAARAAGARAVRPAGARRPPRCARDGCGRAAPLHLLTQARDDHDAVRAGRQRRGAARRGRVLPGVFCWRQAGSSWWVARFLADLRDAGFDEAAAASAVGLT